MCRYTVVAYLQVLLWVLTVFIYNGLLKGMKGSGEMAQEPCTALAEGASSDQHSY